MGARESEDLGVLEKRRLAASRLEGGDTALILKDGVWRALPRSEYDAEAVSLRPLEAFCMRGRKSAVDLGGVLNLGAYPALVEHKEGRGIVCKARAEEAAHHVASSLGRSHKIIGVSPESTRGIEV